MMKENDVDRACAQRLLAVEEVQLHCRVNFSNGDGACCEDNNCCEKTHVECTCADKRECFSC